MKKKVFAIFVLCAACACVFAEDFVRGTVNADLLNMRIKPGLKEAVVGKIPENSEVRITRVVGNWLEISAPENLKIFVAVTRINRDSVVTGELNMRSAMDAKSPILGTLAKGTKVEKTGAVKHGWVQIKKPANVDIKVYVSAFLVKYDSSKFDGSGNIIGAAVPAVEEVKSPAAEKKEVPAAPVVEEVKTPAAPDAPEKMELTGVLTRYKFSTSKDTEYVLLTAPGGYNQAFITGDGTLLQNNENKKVRINGTAAGRFGENGAVIIKSDAVTVL